MSFKLVKHINPIGAIKSFTQLNFNLCMEKRLTILKKLCDKNVTPMNKKLEIYSDGKHKMNFHQFS